jgi:hypothetical protein
MAPIDWTRPLRWSGEVPSCLTGKLHYVGKLASIGYCVQFNDELFRFDSCGRSLTGVGYRIENA